MKYQVIKHPIGKSNIIQSSNYFDDFKTAQTELKDWFYNETDDRFFKDLCVMNSLHLRKDGRVKFNKDFSQYRFDGCIIEICEVNK